MKYGELTLGQVEAVVNKLGGMDGVRQLLSDRLTVSTRRIPYERLFVWKSVPLGDFKTEKRCLAILDREDARVGPDGRELLCGVRYYQVPLMVRLVLLSGSDFGFTKAVKLGAIYQAAIDSGLFLCHPEVGPALFLSFGGQPEGQTVHVAMSPNVVSGFPGIFQVEMLGGRRRLSVVSAEPFHGWDPKWKLAFRILIP